VALLFVFTGSAVEELAVAVFVSVPAVRGVVTEIVTVIVVPLATDPNVQVTVEVPEQLPWLVEEETNVVPAGIVSTSWPAAAAANPKFWTLIV
jgi:hypothetical protein